MAAGQGFKTFNTGDVLSASDVNGYLMQGIWVFANATARDAAVTSPQEGNACYLKDTDLIYTYNGTTWVSSAASGDITAVTAGTGLTGGGSSGDVTVSLSTPVAATNGGTGASTFTTGDILYSSATNTLSKLAIGSTGQVLTVASGVPSWATAGGGGDTMPSFRVYSDTDQSQTANTWTKKNWEVESWDTNSCFASNRFTPTTAGYYQFNWNLSANNTGTLLSKLYKNGTQYAQTQGASVDTSYYTHGSCIVYLNGTSDYVELYSYSSSGSLYNGTTIAYWDGAGVRTA